ncbi:MAG: methyltransferase domain-containing protein [Promethearchaeota archaeon]
MWKKIRYRDIIFIKIIRRFLKLIKKSKKRSAKINFIRILIIIIWKEFQPIYWEKIHSYSKIEKKILPYFQNKKVLRIGGNLRWKFNKYLHYAKKIIDIDKSSQYLNSLIQADYYHDGADLYFLKNESFDIICSSHVIEHLPNPLKALYEWIRIIKKGGIIYCGVLDKRFTFDHKRKRTKLNHLIEDFKKDIDDKDLTHIQEVINKWDSDLDSYWTRNQFIKMVYSKPSGFIHYHIWIKKDIKKLFKYVGLKIEFLALIGNTIHIIGKKV